MNRNIKNGITLLAILALGSIWGHAKPRIYILDTENVLAEEKKCEASKTDMACILELVPGLADIADITGERFMEAGTHEMNDSVWITLSRRVNSLLARDDVDGVIILQDVDEMEETAYFLDLTVKSSKILMLTDALRCVSSASLNWVKSLRDAVKAASAWMQGKRGTLIYMDGEIFPANEVRTDAATPKPHAKKGKVRHGTQKDKTVKAPDVFELSGVRVDKLPKVGIVYGYEGANVDMMEPFLNPGNGYQGIIHVGGRGHACTDILSQLIAAQERGIVVVNSSREPFDESAESTLLGFVASEGLNPKKARILLMLALTQTREVQKIQGYFRNH